MHQECESSQALRRRFVTKDAKHAVMQRKTLVKLNELPRNNVKAFNLTFTVNK